VCIVQPQHSEQESRAIAKMTARCALYVDALKILDLCEIGPIPAKLSLDSRPSFHWIFPYVRETCAYLLRLYQL